MESVKKTMAWQCVNGSFEFLCVLEAWHVVCIMFFYFIIIIINMLAQMVKMLAFDAHVLGSIPGVCILLFSQQLQANPVLHIFKCILYTLNISHLMCSWPDPICPQWRFTMLLKSTPSSDPALTRLDDKWALQKSYMHPSSSKLHRPNSHFLFLFLFYILICLITLFLLKSIFLYKIIKSRIHKKN